MRGRPLSARFATWLLPEPQASTFRIAVGIIRTARAIAPKKEVVYFPTSPGEFLTTSPHNLNISPYEWDAPQAAMRELEEDLVAEERVIDPVRLVWPLFAQAVGLHVTNHQQRAKGWVVAALRITATLTVAFVVLPLLSLGNWRDRRRALREGRVKYIQDERV